MLPTALSASYGGVLAARLRHVVMSFSGSATKCVQQMRNVTRYVAVLFAMKARIIVSKASLVELEPGPFREIFRFNRERSTFTEGHAQRTASVLTLSASACAASTLEHKWLRSTHSLFLARRSSGEPSASVQTLFEKSRRSEDVAAHFRGKKDQLSRTRDRKRATTLTGVNDSPPTEHPAPHTRYRPSTEGPERLTSEHGGT